MTEEIKKHLGLLPYTVPLIYFLGYILISGYLSDYNYSDYELLNMTYLKAGVLFTVLIVIIFIATRLSFTKESMTDDLNKSWISLILVVHNILFVTYLLVLYLVDFEVFDNKYIRFSIYSLICILFLLNSFTNYNNPTKSKRWWVPIVLGIIIFGTLNFIYASYSVLASYLLYFNVFVSFFISISLSLYGDKSYDRKFVIDIILIIVLSFFFGKKIYSLIPYKIGGGESYNIIIDNNCLTKPPSISPDTMSVIYENDRNIICIKNERTIVLDKSQIECFYLLTE